MEIKLTPIATLKHDSQNARAHTTRNLDTIVKSLEKFGQRKPIVTRNGVVIAGNGTLEAAKKLHWDEILTAEVPADWDDDTAKAYAIADNRSSDLAEWDNAALYETLAELTEIDALDLTGFSQAEFDELSRVVNGTQGEFDRKAEWVGMPEFEQPNKNSPFHCVVHFTSEENAKAFFDIINRPMRKTFWWPQDDGLVGADKDFHYISEE